jgi:hypothetical protein
VSNLWTAIILGIPLALFGTAIGMIVWRAVYPRRNKIMGLTDRNGQIVNPSIHLGVSVICMLSALVCAWWLVVAKATEGTRLTHFKSHLDLMALLSISTALALQFFKQYKKLKKAASKTNA